MSELYHTDENFKPPYWDRKYYTSFEDQIKGEYITVPCMSIPITYLILFCCRIQHLTDRPQSTWEI